MTTLLALSDDDDVKTIPNMAARPLEGVGSTWLSRALSLFLSLYLSLSLSLSFSLPVSFRAMQKQAPPHDTTTTAAEEKMMFNPSGQMLAARPLFVKPLDHSIDLTRSP